MRVNPHFRLGTHRMSKSNIWHRVLARNPLFAFFLPAHRARAKKVVRAPALRERDSRDSNEPLGGAAATQHRTRVTKQPSCEFLLVLDALALPWDA